MTRTFARVTIRTALIVGFGLTLGLWLFAGYQVTRRVSDEQRNAAEANARYIQAQDLLASVRAQVLLASVVVGDALLDPTRTSRPIAVKSIASFTPSTPRSRSTSLSSTPTPPPNISRDFAGRSTTSDPHRERCSTSMRRAVRPTARRCFDD
jgi:hypothetical protein